MVASILAQIGIPVLIEAIGEAVERIDNPFAKSAGKALNQLDQQIKAGQVDHASIREANRHIEVLEKYASDQARTAIAEVNKSLRAEVASSDMYVRRMRPTFGYIMAVTWGAQMLSVAYTILAVPEDAGKVISAMGDLSAIWTVGLSVLGIYVYKRSQEKARG